MADMLRLGILQAELAGYPATGIVLNPIDWARIELLKDSAANYMIGDPIGTTTPRLWGLPVAVTTAMTVDKWLLGAFGLAAQIFDRMDAEVLISSEDRDNFIKNMLTVRAEQRLALVVRRPAALVKGDFGNVA